MENEFERNNVIWTCKLVQECIGNTQGHWRCRDRPLHQIRPQRANDTQMNFITSDDLSNSPVSSTSNDHGHSVSSSSSGHVHLVTGTSDDHDHSPVSSTSNDHGHSVSSSSNDHGHSVSSTSDDHSLFVLWSSLCILPIFTRKATARLLKRYAR